MMGVRGTALVGLIPRIAHLLFFSIATDTEREFFVEGSYLEIYNEQIKDLMDKNNTETLKVRESPQLGVHVAGLSRHHVKTSDDCEKLIENGTGNRTVAATKYNSESSRSHAVFELHIQQKYVDKLTMEEMNSKTKICLIDLAGSERSDKLGSVGTALKEGNNINKSLTVLGRCIKGLVEQCNNPKKKIQVPFRESVLTWYLRDSLAGNSRTTMLACVSPAGSNEEETLSTLRYAASAKQIKTSAVKQEDPLKAKVRELSEEVERLKKASNRTLGGKMMETHEHCISSIPYRGDTVTCSAYLPNYYFLRFGNLGGKAVAEEASVGRRTPSRRV
jgi:kinesin family protein 1